MRVAWTVALLAAMTLACGEPKVESGSDAGTRVDIETADPFDAGLPLADAGFGIDGGETETELTESEKLLINLPADSWYRVPKGYIEKCDDTFTLPWHAIMGCYGLVSAWNSGVWDPRNRQMLLWGGGHADYAGNELYAFSTKDFTWSRLTEPSLGPYNRDPLNDGKPVSRHTYDSLTWDDHKNVMLAWGGSRSMDGGGTDITWTFDPISKVWTNQQPSGAIPRSSYDHTLVYDAASKTAFLKKTQGFFAYDTVANTWSSIANFGNPPYWPRYAGGAPYVLNLDTKTWTTKSSVGAPAKSLTHGTFGRFRYIKKYNVLF